MDFAVENGVRFALLDPNELVYVGMNLLSDVFADFQCHQHELHVLRCVKDRPEELVLLRRLFNIDAVSGHALASLRRTPYVPTTCR